MPVVIQPGQPGQSTLTKSVEVSASRGRSSLGEHLAISGGSARSNVVFSGEIPANAQQTTSFQATRIRALDSHWSAPLERRFAHLAARIAARSATAAEQEEFESLQSTRRRVYLARRGNSIIRDFEERERTAALIAALKRYVEFASN